MKTSKPSWEDTLTSLLTSLKPTSEHPAGQRVALLGIGNEFSADDSAGVILIRRLHRSIGANPGVLLLEGGLAPENQTGALRAFEPQLVILIDAGNFDAPIGKIELFDWQELTGFSGSSHILPPSVLSRFLVETCGCRVIVMAIQAGTVEFDQPVTPVVRRAVNRAARFFEQNLAPTPPSHSPAPQ